jgi:hypothetical protein
LSFAQLYELKIYDKLLDKFIDKCYEALEDMSVSYSFIRLHIFSKRYKRASARIFDLLKLNVGLVEVVQNISNSTKVTDDYYLSRFYRSFLSEMQFFEWFTNVKNKLSEIQEIDSMVLERVDVVRSTMLEFWIVLLIVFEIVLAFIPGHNIVEFIGALLK